MLRLETTWGLEGQAEGSAAYLRSSSAWESSEGDGQDQSSVQTQTPLLPWRAGYRGPAPRRGVSLRQGPPPEPRLAGCGEPPPDPLLGGSGMRSRGMEPLRKAENVFSASPASSPMPRPGLKVRAGWDTPRPTAALPGPGSSLPALFWSHCSLAATPTRLGAHVSIGTAGRGANDHKQPLRLGPDSSTAAPPDS